MTLRRYDLNQLPVLDALLRHRNVTSAGAELGLTQSATSSALGRLRVQFKDPLLVRDGRKLQLTRRAEALIEPVAAALEQMRRLLEADAFEPARATRRFYLGTADYVSLLVLPHLVRDLDRVAPMVSVQTNWAGDGMSAELRSGELDLALVPRGSLDDENLLSAPLFEDEMVVAACAANQEIGEQLTLETYLRLPHAEFRNASPAARSFAERQLAHNRLERQSTVLVSEFLLLPLILPGTRLVCLIHRRLGEKIAAVAPIRLLPAPFPTDRIHLRAYWSHAADSDAGHRWFREHLIRMCQTVL